MIEVLIYAVYCVFPVVVLGPYFWWLSNRLRRREEERSAVRMLALESRREKYEEEDRVYRQHVETIHKELKGLREEVDAYLIQYPDEDPADLTPRRSNALLEPAA